MNEKVWTIAPNETKSAAISNPKAVGGGTWRDGDNRKELGSRAIGAKTDPYSVQNFTGGFKNHVWWVARSVWLSRHSTWVERNCRCWSHWWRQQRGRIGIVGLVGLEGFDFNERSRHPRDRSRRMGKTWIFYWLYPRKIVHLFTIDDRGTTSA